VSNPRRAREKSLRNSAKKLDVSSQDVLPAQVFARKFVRVAIKIY
jgi:hypothetical protein